MHLARTIPSNCLQPLDCTSSPSSSSSSSSKFWDSRAKELRIMPTPETGALPPQAHVVKLSQRDLLDYRAVQRTFDGAYSRTALGQLCYAIVILRLFQPKFFYVGEFSCIDTNCFDESRAEHSAFASLLIWNLYRAGLCDPWHGICPCCHLPLSHGGQQHAPIPEDGSD